MTSSSIAAEDEPTTSSSSTAPMGPPPPKNPNPDILIPSDDTQQLEDKSIQVQQSSVPYTIPEWSGIPCHRFYFEVLKDGSIMDQFDVCKKGAYMFGRIDLCDFVLEHPTISRFHAAVIQFRKSGAAYLYDVGSTHGTFVNKNQVKKRVYVDLHVGDVIRFGQSSRLYIFQGPSELMPVEKDLKIIRESKMQQEMIDREDSLRRARMNSSLADGISWGMGEDAIEEAEDDDDEVTWQTYKGQLTEKQEKTREKIIKRTEKIAHMKKEIDLIRAKDISQGGLTQGQQTQIARNEQRMTQIMEELENLEETLNESIRESIGARSGIISRGGRKGAAEDDEDFSSDDDEFYDRTKKKPLTQNAGENQIVETADTLLDKRDALMKEIEDKEESLEREKNKMASETAVENEAGDALDAYMSGLSSQLVLDKTAQLQKELSTLQSELDRIFYLLKIADPMGETTKRRDTKVQEPKLHKPEMPADVVKHKPPIEPISAGSAKSVNVSMQKEKTPPVTAVESNKPEADNIVNDADEGKAAVYTIAKPQWLGAVEDKETKKTEQENEVVFNTQEPDQFVDYKDRQKILSNADETLVKDSGIETAASGLIIRKKKQIEDSEGVDDKAHDHETSSSVGPELKAEDAVALLLKHKRGYHAEDDEETKKTRKDKKKRKRVVGPEKPSFLSSDSDCESWVPPEGQSGDGRTALNERYGY
ncbi:hypothetical protein Dsin_017008 [Dipteronia sinensis]|uniref:FHA domain-containing protein n=1 Tax=Dipteronia sinensis TaxID=43782 RepID=A0AAE0E6A7_9ROSI|nr:hypothetical protein Dsin_017008 [Dipteronia sinensis]